MGRGWSDKGGRREKRILYRVMKKNVFFISCFFQEKKDMFFSCFFRFFSLHPISSFLKTLLMVTVNL